MKLLNASHCRYEIMRIYVLHNLHVILLYIDHTQNGTLYIYTIYTWNINMYIQNKYIQIHKNQSVATNLMKVSIFN